jgi:hypothetical protein
MLLIHDLREMTAAVDTTASAKNCCFGSLRLSEWHTPTGAA